MSYLARLFPRAAAVKSATWLAKCACAALAFLFFFTSPAAPQAKKSPIAPNLFEGKTIEACQKILGKPSYIEVSKKPKVANYIRYYFKPKVAGLKRIMLARVPNRGMVGDVERTVNLVEYQFPTGKVTWEQALEIVGIDRNTVKSEEMGEGRTEFTNIPGGYTARWNTAQADSTLPKEYQHPEVDTLWLVKF